MDDKKYYLYKSILTEIANSIRNKLNESELITPNEFSKKISNIDKLDDGYYINPNEKNISVSSSQTEFPSIVRKLPTFKVGFNKSINNIFNGCCNVEEINLIQDGAITQCIGVFNNCRSLKKAPYLDTSSSSYFSSMFFNCYALEEVPMYDLSNPNLNNIGLQNMFGGGNTISKLSDTSLNNILKMCISVRSDYSTKTLTHLGFSARAVSSARWQTCESYQDFINAGWSIGYE